MIRSTHLPNMADQAAAAMEFVMSYGVTGMLLTAVLGLAIISKIRAVIFFNPKVRGVPARRAQHVHPLAAVCFALAAPLAHRSLRAGEFTGLRMHALRFGMPGLAKGVRRAFPSNLDPPARAPSPVHAVNRAVVVAAAAAARLVARQAPPHVPSPLPWLGNIVAFGEKPIDFLLGSYNKVLPDCQRRASSDHSFVTDTAA